MMMNAMTKGIAMKLDNKRHSVGGTSNEGDLTVTDVVDLH
jgi:hypothetical protein